MPLHNIARDMALTKARIAATHNRDQLIRALAHYLAPPRAAKILDLICCGLGVSDHTPLSNFGVRIKASEVLVDLSLRQHDRVRHDRDVRHFFFTGTWDDGITLEHAPELNFARMELKVRRLLTKLGLDAICAFELDVLSKKLAGDPARLILGHVHALCWTRDAGFRPVVCARELSALPQYSNRLGLPGVDFTTRAMSAARHRAPIILGGAQPPEDPRFRNLDTRDQNAPSMADLGRYMLKAPTCAKDRSQADDGSWRVCNDQDAFGLNTALRFAEIWSQITPADCRVWRGLRGRRAGPHI